MHNISIKSLFIGKNLLFMSMCHSTNEYAESLINANNFFEGTTIVTFNQTKGKGQRGNTWQSEPGKNLTFSIIIKPFFISISQQFYLHIITSLSVLKVFSTLSPFFKVKWPNDIYWNNQKIGGILIENKLKINRIETCVVGIGLNINQADFHGLNATSLRNILGKEVELELILAEILSSFEFYYLKLKQGGFTELYNEYLDNLYWKDEVRTFKSDNLFIGEIIGIDAFGKLKILIGSEVRSFDFKEIQFIE